MGENKIDGKIEALWDDWTDIEIGLLEGETESENNLQVVDRKEIIEVSLVDFEKD
jgi:hypothetical protein